MRSSGGGEKALWRGPWYARILAAKRAVGRFLPRTRIALGSLAAATVLCSCIVEAEVDHASELLRNATLKVC